MRRTAVAVLVTVWVLAAPAAGAQTKSLLWAVTAADGAVTWLMGSVHVLTPEYYPLSPKVEEAFASSKVLIEEIDLAEMEQATTQLAVLARALYTDGRTLDQVVKPEVYREVVRRAGDAGMPEQAVRRMKPWMAAIALTAPALQSAGFDPKLGLDRYFFDKAKEAGLERRALETIAFQLDTFDGMPAPVQAAMLETVLDNVDVQLAEFRKIADAWKAGDAATLERLLLEAFRSSPEIYERIIVARNRNWVAPVSECVDQQARCFVVVGAAHLVGPDSLVALLKQKGYQVTQH